MKELITVPALGEMVREEFKKVLLKDLQKRVGGHIVKVSGPPFEGTPATYWVDEDGLPKGLPVNNFATSVLGQTIVGTLVIERKLP